MRIPATASTQDPNDVLSLVTTGETHLTQSLLTEHQAAVLLMLSPATLKKWRRTRRGPRYYRLGSAVRYKREDLEAFVSESAENPCSPRHNGKGDR
jgi:hypothetical protein